MTSKAIEKEIRNRFPMAWQITVNEIKRFTSGIKTINELISRNPKLRNECSFAKIKKALIDDYALRIEGRGACLTENKIEKERDILGDLADRKTIQWLIDNGAINPKGRMPGGEVINKIIPEIIHELAKGFIRPAFRKEKIDPTKFYTIKEAADLLGISPATIRTYIYNRGLLDLAPKEHNRGKERTIYGAMLKEFEKYIGAKKLKDKKMRKKIRLISDAKNIAIENVLDGEV